MHSATSILVSQFINDKESRTGFFRNIAAKLNKEGILISADLSGNVDFYEYELILHIWTTMMMHGKVQSQSIENIRQSHKNGIAFLPPEEVADIIESAGFEKPVQFYQMAFIHGWFCRK